MTVATRTLLLQVLSVLPAYGAVTFSGRSLREYELKHARVAMLALPVLNGLAVAGIQEPVQWLSHQPIDMQLVVFSTAGILEAAFTLPRFEGRNFRLKDTVIPGEFALLDPPPVVRQSELLIGRSAMLVAFSWLVTGA